MFIYWLEQVLIQDIETWRKLNNETRELLVVYWDYYHLKTPRKPAYPFDHMIEGEDHVDW